MLPLLIFLKQHVARGPETVQDVSNEVVTERHTPYGGYYICCTYATILFIYAQAEFFLQLDSQLLSDRIATTAARRMLHATHCLCLSDLIRYYHNLQGYAMRYSPFSTT